MSLFLLNLLLAIAWGALTGKFEPLNLLFGFLLAFAILWVGFRGRSQENYFTRVPRVVELALYFAVDIFKANLRLAGIILSPRMNLRPAVVAVPLEVRTEAGLILLMNLITLTPGTLSLDVSSDRRVLFVHTVYLEDPQQFISSVKEGYERRVMRIVEP